MNVLAIGIASASLLVPSSGTVGGPSAQQPRVEELLTDFKKQDTHVRASQAIKSLPPRTVVPALVHAIRVDPDVSSTDWLRAAAYSLLIGIGKEGEPPLYKDPQQIRQLIAGLGDVDPGIQSLCVQAMPAVDTAYCTEVVAGVSPLLASEDPYMIGAAANTLGGVGQCAREALSALRHVLAAQDEAARAKWERGRALHADAQRDVEITARAAAGYARIAIDGVAIDIDLYPSLDWRGQAAAIEALRAPLMRGLSAKDGPIPIPMDTLVSANLFLSNCLTEPRMGLEHKVMALHLVGNMAISIQVPDDIRADALSTLRSLESNEDEGASALKKVAKLYMKS